MQMQIININYIRTQFLRYYDFTLMPITTFNMLEKPGVQGILTIKLQLENIEKI